jgi:pimeloyl-ACP methyl ester carboxylesterase
MIMGSGSTRDLWPPEVLCSLSSEYKVVIFDNRGMGYTTAPPGNFSIVQFPEERLKVTRASISSFRFLKRPQLLRT